MPHQNSKPIFINSTDHEIKQIILEFPFKNGFVDMISTETLTAVVIYIPM